MARHGFVALLAVTAFSVFGVDASPCKPSPSTTVELSSTTIETGSSTVILETSTTIAETLSTAVTTETAETTDVTSTITEEASTTEGTTTDTTTEISISTDATTTEAATTFDTTTTILEETTSAETTTTTKAPVIVVPPPCTETQVIVNPGFNDNAEATPWVLGEGVTVSSQNPRSDPYFLATTFTRGGSGSRSFSQTLHNVGPQNYRLEYYISMNTAINGRGFSCSATPSINGEQLAQSPSVGDNGPYGFRQAVAFWSTPSATQNVDEAELIITVSCTGSYDTVIITVDDVSLTRQCDVF
ncbi:hypothetical protein FSARC_14861 [Fusarium sarcochroum]|uniref:CBM-cenC domain-containing protein n=1 Tax=Fusarium sarcochroum TaxID=1208366 RepID=A0A8H4SQ50_9HYPO|nr:hypothetical protein FSARC_14861 [Fusarium sarcochroum]